MKRFRFPLEALLATRKIREEQARRQLGDLRNKLNAEQDELDRLKSARLDQAASFREVQADGEAAVGDFLLYENYLTSLSNGITEQAASVNVLAAGVEAKRLEVIDRSKQRKVVEHIRERRFAGYKAQVLKEEQDFLNEVGIIAHGRRAQSPAIARVGEAVG